MSDLLKVRVGGSDYLCKWEKSSIYKMDFNRFDINTLKDGDVQWNFYNNNRDGVTLSKANDGLIIDIAAGSTRQFNLPLNQFNLDKEFITEYEIDITNCTWTMYYGFGRASLTYSVREFQGLGLWLYHASNLQIYEGSMTYSSSDWSRITGMSYSFPLKVKTIYDPNTQYVKVYFFDSLIMEGNIDGNGNITFNNGGSGNGTCKLYSLKIYYS